MELKPLIAILLAVVILGCVQTEYKSVTFPEHPISTSISISTSTPALTLTPKPTQTPTIKPVATTPPAEPTLTPTPTPTLTPTKSGVKIVYIHYDAPGNDWYNPNGEYVVIRNYGPDPVNLKGWKLKDKAGHTFVFPDITIQPGESVYVYSGKGVNSGNELYWGDGAIWNNNGDTAYLYDSSGRLVDTYSY